MARYGLANHVFVCRDEEYIVVLDLRQDRYFALEAGRTAVLAPLLPGWPAQPSDAVPGAGPEPAATAVVESLLRRGWLLELPAPAKDATPARLPPPQAELLTELNVASAKIGARAVISFVAASVFAKFALRFWRFERVIQRVGERKAARPAARRPLDVERARQLVDAFGRLRVFLFSHKEKCLHDSLALLEFLARHDVFPRWVFGVRARPFVAHCWVQHDDIVFNDTVEHSSTYIPIMVV